MGTISVRVLAVLGLLLGLTIQEQPRFRSDVALWASALRFNQTDPRPAFNYGQALRVAGDFDGAVAPLLVALQRAAGHPREAWYRDAVRVQFISMEWSGYFICDSAYIRPHC